MQVLTINDWLDHCWQVRKLVDSVETSEHLAASLLEGVGPVGEVKIDY